MADDWIPWTIGLASKPEIASLALRFRHAFVTHPPSTGASTPPSTGIFARRAIAATMVELWAEARGVTADGVVKGWDLEYLDDFAGIRGFGAALVEVGWVREVPGGVEFARWERWNGKGAKARLQANNRQQKWRGNVDASPSTSPSTGASTTALPDQSESIEKKKKKKEGDASANLAWSAMDGWTGITQPDRDGWANAYPACDLDRQLAAADQWLRANPERAHKSAWRRFVTNWLARAQEKGGDRQYQNGAASGYRRPASNGHTAGIGKAEARKQAREAGQYPEEMGHVRTI